MSDVRRGHDGLVFRAKKPQARCHFAALLDCIRAAPAEAAALTRIHDAGRFGDGRRPRPARREHAGFGHGREQELCVRVLGMREDVLYRPALGDLSGIHDDQAIRDVTSRSQCRA